MAIRIPKKPKRKPGQRAGMTRAKIALAAAAHMEKVGPSAFSIRHLAKSLGVAPTTISAHFKGGIADIEDEIVRTVLADVAPPFEPNQEPIDYLNKLFCATLKSLEGRPTVAMLTVLRLSQNPFVAPKLAERSLGSLAALGVAPEKMASAFRMTLRALLTLIFSGPSQTSSTVQAEAAKLKLSPPALQAGEFPNIWKFREAVIDEYAKAAAWALEVKTVMASTQRLVRELGVA